MRDMWYMEFYLPFRLDASGAKLNRKKMENKSVFSPFIERTNMIEVHYRYKTLKFYFKITHHWIKQDKLLMVWWTQDSEVWYVRAGNREKQGKAEKDVYLRLTKRGWHQHRVRYHHYASNNQLKFSTLHQPSDAAKIFCQRLEAAWVLDGEGQA